MKLKVLKTFRDKVDGVTVYHAGEEIDIKEETRVADLVKRGLCEKTAAGSPEGKPSGTVAGGTAVGSPEGKASGTVAGGTEKTKKE